VQLSKRGWLQPPMKLSKVARVAAGPNHFDTYLVLVVNGNILSATRR